MSVPKINDLVNNAGSGAMAVLFKTNNTNSDGSLKSGFYTDDGNTKGTSGYKIPAKDDDYDMFVYTIAGINQIYYDSKSNGECHVHFGADRVTVSNDAKLELDVESDGSLSMRVE